MTAQKLDGSATLKTIKAELTERVARLRERGVVRGLGTVLVGEQLGIPVRAVRPHPAR